MAQGKLRTQGTYFMVTLSYLQARLADWTPAQFYLEHDDLVWLRGQEEKGSIDGYHHWQFIIGMKKHVRVSHVIKMFAPLHPHIELTYSKDADNYVWKEDTRVPGTQFEFGLTAQNY